MTPSSFHPRNWRTALMVLTGLAIVGLGGVSIIGLLGNWSVVFDLFNHFRLQYVVIAGILAAISLVLRRRELVVISAVLLVLNAWTVVPLVAGSTGPDGDGVALRLVQFNVLTSNLDVERAAAWIDSQDADVVMVQEVDQRWVDGLDTLLTSHERVPTDTVRPDNFGLAFYLRNGVSPVAVDVVGGPTSDLPRIALQIDVGADVPPLLLYGIHTLPPTSPDAWETSAEMMELAADTVNAHPGSSIIVGDLNATRWSSLVRSTIDDTDLRDGGEGHGVRGTWPARLWFTGGMTIDHALVSSDIRIDGRSVGPDLGSDHRPVTFDLVLVSP